MKDHWVGMAKGSYINMSHVFQLKPDGDGGCHLVGVDGKTLMTIDNSSPTDMIKLMDHGTVHFGPRALPPAPTNAAAFSLEEIEQAQEQINGSKP